MPVDKVINNSVIHWDWFKVKRAGSWLFPATNIIAKTGARKNLKAVAVKKETLFKTYLEIAVDDPHKNPAERAKAPATTVPLPVAKFTVKSLKVIKYAAISANIAQIIKDFVIFSFKSKAAADIAQIG